MPESHAHESGGIAIGGWADTGLMVLIVALVLWILKRQGAITDNLKSQMDTVKAEIVEYWTEEEKPQIVKFAEGYEVLHTTAINVLLHVAERAEVKADPPAG